MSERKFSPEDVLKILRVCNDRTRPVEDRCAECPDEFPRCCDHTNGLMAADTIEELLERRQMDADVMQEQKERIVELEDQLRWIPVTERLPELIPCNAGDGHGYSEAVQICTDGKKVLTAVYSDLGWIFDGGFWAAWDETVTHWRPVVGNLPWAVEGA